MQNIPQTNGEEKHVWPDLTITGEDIHRALTLSSGADDIFFKPWDEISPEAKQLYNDLARELNVELNARQAWFEGEDVTVSAVRCPQCTEMLQAEHAEGHACWLEAKG